MKTTDNNDSKHTPTPWSVTKQLGNHLIYKGLVGDSVRENIAATFSDERSEANAALIVRAVNNLEANEKRIKELEELIVKCRPYIADLNADNFNDPSVGIFQDDALIKIGEQIEAVCSARHKATE